MTKLQDELSDSLNPAEIEVLIPEAKQRQKKRRRLFTVIAVLAIAGASSAVALIGSGGSGTGGGTSLAKNVLPPAATSKSPSLSHETAVSISQGIPTTILNVGTVNKSTVWAENCQGFYLSTDDGVKWQNITPSTINYGIESICNRSEGIFSNGTQLFMFVSEVAGLGDSDAPGMGGGSRGEGLEISSNNGQSWTLVQPPGCDVDRCGPFGLLPNGGLFELANNTLYESYNLGTTWTPIQQATTLGPTEYVNSQYAWEVTEDYGHGLEGQLYRSTDGGTHWENASPGTNSKSLTYDLPVFFRDTNGVVLAHPTSIKQHAASIVFTTTDGGQTWQRHTIPGNNTSEYYPPQLSAISALDWLVADGGSLYETTNAGASWTVISKGLPWSTNGVLQMAFSSPNVGYVIVSGTISLMATTSRGRKWVNVNP